MRRTLIIIAAVIVIIGVGAWAYLRFVADRPSVAVVPTPVAGLPVAEQAPADPTGEVVAPTTVLVEAVAGARLIKVSEGPIVPGIILTDRTPALLSVASSSASSTSPGYFLTYIARKSGNVFSYSSASRVITRTNNKTIPGIQSAEWLPSAAVAFVQYLSGSNLSTVNTYALPADGGNGFFLEQGIADLKVSSTNILMLASGTNGSIGTLRATDGSRASQAFSSPLSSLRIAFAGQGTLLAFTKPSAALPGAAFLIDRAGRFSRIVGPLPGLVALPSPSGGSILVSYIAEGAMRMQLVDTLSGAVTTLPVGTVADKCAWSADGAAIYCGIPVSPPVGYAYPDDWYQGAVSFDDRIWRINVAGRFAELVLDYAKETGGRLDAYSLALDPSGNALAFLNKNDGSLWVYSL